MVLTSTSDNATNDAISANDGNDMDSSDGGKHVVCSCMLYTYAFCMCMCIDIIALT